MQTENSNATSLRQLAKMPNHVLVVCGFLAVADRRQLIGTRVCHVIVYRYRYRNRNRNRSEPSHGTYGSALIF